MADKSDGFNLDDLARQLAQSLPKNLRALGGDIERNFRALLQAGLEKMDLVTREEFDVQSAVLERTREKLEKIDARLRELESGLASRKKATRASGSPKPTSGVSSSAEPIEDVSGSGGPVPGGAGSADISGGPTGPNDSESSGS